MGVGRVGGGWGGGGLRAPENCPLVHPSVGEMWYRLESSVLSSIVVL